MAFQRFMLSLINCHHQTSSNLLLSLKTITLFLPKALKQKRSGITLLNDPTLSPTSVQAFGGQTEQSDCIGKPAIHMYTHCISQQKKDETCFYSVLCNDIDKHVKETP